MDFELKQNLENALTLFERRGFVEWANEITNALSKLENQDLSFVKPLWLKCGPTCEIDDLYIINVQEKDQDSANQLNNELAQISNSLFASLDKNINEKT